jgi:hypothetical protein
VSQPSEVQTLTVILNIERTLPMANTIPSPTAGAGDDKEYKGYTHQPSHGPDPQRTVIGGTHNVSVKIDPDAALRGAYTEIPGDAMPSGAPVDGNPAYNGPILPEN